MLMLFVHAMHGVHRLAGSSGLKQYLSKVDKLGKVNILANTQAVAMLLHNIFLVPELTWEKWPGDEANTMPCT